MTPTASIGKAPQGSHDDDKLYLSGRQRVRGGYAFTPKFERECDEYLAWLESQAPKGGEGAQ